MSKSMSGKRFWFWLGVVDAKANKQQDRRALRQDYEGQEKPVWKQWQKVSYLTGYWQTKLIK